MITQILLNNLDSDNNRISYRRDWNKITGSVTATILLQQVYYWYKINDFKPFYKFKCAPSKPHKLYNPDKPDDWCSELGFTEREFDGALKRIGFKYTQKTKNQKHSQLVEFWTDSSRVTHYKLNMVNFLCALMDLYLTNNLSVTKTTKSDLANLQNDIYETYKLDFTKSTKSSLPITDTTSDTTSDTTKEEHAEKSAPPVFDQPEKKETSKSDKKEMSHPPVAATPFQDFPECDEDLKPVFGFQNFWDTYDMKLDRAKCESKWKKLKQSEINEIERTLSFYVADTVKDDSEQTKGVWRRRRKNPITYLNQKTWKDYADATGPLVKKSGKVVSIGKDRPASIAIIDDSKYDKWRNKAQTT